MSTKIYKGHKFDFFQGKYINEGGNGIVFNVKCSNIENQELVIKKFKHNVKKIVQI